jgi:hypothetical protein
MFNKGAFVGKKKFSHYQNARYNNKNCRNADDSIKNTKCILLLHFLDDRTIVNLHCYGTTMCHLKEGVQMKEIMSPNFFAAEDKMGSTI